MPKYMLQGSYTAQGVKGLLKDGGTGRRKAVEGLVASAGGKLESIYYAFGGDDVFVIVDLPDAESAAAISLAVAAAGAVNIRTTVLLTPEQMDAAAKKTVSYRPPGG